MTSAALLAVLAVAAGCAGRSSKDAKESGVSPEATSTIDVTQFVDFRPANAVTSNVDILSEDGVFVATATIAAKDYESVSDEGNVLQAGQTHGVAVTIDFVANKPVRMVNFPEDEHEYEFGPSLSMSRDDNYAEPDTANDSKGKKHYLHFELIVFDKNAMFPDGNDMVITFEGVTAADELGARIAPSLFPLSE